MSYRRSMIDRLRTPIFDPPVEFEARAEALQVQKIAVPHDPHQFYVHLGLLTHPRTQQVVNQLTAYQYRIWQAGFNYKYRLVVKSQKVGISTSVLLEDFQHAMTDCKGYDILLIAQTQDAANEHLRTLKYMIAGSHVYNKYLISSSEMLFKEEKTKASAIYIKNPDNPYKPSRIIGLGATEGRAWSWKSVKHIHMSDIAATQAKDDSGLFGAAFSRLANSDGSIIIESPPRGQRGSFWRIYKQSKLKVVDDFRVKMPLDSIEDKLALNPDNVFAADEINIESQFKVFEIPADYAVQAGLIKQSFLDSERQRLGPLYSQFYECEFINAGNAWYDLDMIKHEDYEISA